MEEEKRKNKDSLATEQCLTISILDLESDSNWDTQDKQLQRLNYKPIHYT